MRHFPTLHGAVVIALVASVSAPISSQQPPASMSQKLPTATRIEVRQGSGWTRGVVSEDAGPQSAQIKVRLDPDKRFMVVPRNGVRLAPRPASIKVGDHLEWYDNATFAYEPAVVKELGTGSMAGWYRMVSDAYPKSTGMYSKPENLFLLPGQSGTPTASDKAPTLGKYICQAYGAAGSPPIFLGEIELRAGGVYAGFQSGTYAYDAATQTITWVSGGMKDNKFGGKVESNAVIRIRPTSICSHR